MSRIYESYLIAEEMWMGEELYDLARELHDKENDDTIEFVYPKYGYDDTLSIL